MRSRWALLSRRCLEGLGLLRVLQFLVRVYCLYKAALAGLVIRRVGGGVLPQMNDSLRLLSLVMCVMFPRYIVLLQVIVCWINMLHPLSLSLSMLAVMIAGSVFLRNP